MGPRAILLVEDDPGGVELTKRALVKAHIPNPLVVVSDGQEALDYLFGTGVYAGRDTSDMPVLTLLDLHLPKVQGLDVLRRIRQETVTRRLPVVIFSTSGEDGDVAAGYDLGANGYLRKPVSFADFVQRLAHAGTYWLTVNEPPPELRS